MVLIISFKLVSKTKLVSKLVSAVRAKLKIVDSIPISVAGLVLQYFFC